MYCRKKEYLSKSQKVIDVHMNLGVKTQKREKMQDNLVFKFVMSARLIFHENSSKKFGWKMEMEN